ncbi:peptidoglycan recognition protein family protein [Clostridium sp. Marseille-P2415]|uniref:peptidoglycan recognition protein family protein n=1 Tax=Clostridium sp. Marseille-P2415 TaxID=1805471 RepID=UPI0009888517|nr:N-acetylmuramoyl-L-alanine amidase [Clostridium sp. Marseille-P2415]
MEKLESSKEQLRIIAVEEHYLTPAFLQGIGKEYAMVANPANGHPMAGQFSKIVEMSGDLGEKRIANMDDTGVDVQVLSMTSLGAEGLQGAEVIQLIPEDEISWCTNSANSYTISIEACHPKADGKFTDETYKSYVELCVDLCKRWGLDPEHGGLIRHYDVTKKVCPKWFVDHADAWDQFKKEVAIKIKQEYEIGWNHDSNSW